MKVRDLERKRNKRLAVMRKARDDAREKWERLGRELKSAEMDSWLYDESIKIRGPDGTVRFVKDLIPDYVRTVLDDWEIVTDGPTSEQKLEWLVARLKERSPSHVACELAKGRTVEELYREAHSE